MRELLLSAAIFIILFTGCAQSKREIDNKLDAAETMLREDPAKAFQQLDEIDVSKLSDSSTIARWISLYGDALLSNGFASIDGNDSLQARYIQKLQDCSEQRARHDRQSSIIISVLMTIIVILFVVFQTRRIMIHKAKDEVLLTKASSLQSAVKCNKLLLTRRFEAINNSFADRLTEIDRLCNKYYNIGGTALEKYEIIRELSVVMDSMKCDAEAFHLFEGAVNERRPQLLGLLRKELPDISRDEYRLFVFLACGVSSQAISLLTGDKVSTLYYKRAKLREKCNKASIDSQHILLEML